MEFEAVIGLEVHAQLLTSSKLFCTSSTTFGGEPNSQGSPVSLGLPGALPVLNRRALEYAIKASLALNCEVAALSRFARKHYFYPDLPKGYQISQYEEPLAEHGWLNIEVNGTSRRIDITRIHMEEDAGKLTHDISVRHSHVDLNRAGVPLIEIVSEPDLRSPDEAVEYIKKLRTILIYLGVCDGNMEEGSLRCDVNISVRPRGTSELGTKAEIKNINSFKFVHRALEYEIRRQTGIIESGGTIQQETRLFDSAKGITASMRSKEFAHDYRYFSDPDLPPVIVTPEQIEATMATIPELPDAKRERFTSDYGLPAYDAGVLTAEKSTAEYFESCLEHYEDPKAVSNWVMNELLRELKGHEEAISTFPVTPVKLTGLLKLIDDGTISGKMAKDVFTDMVSTGKDARDTVAEMGLEQISDTSELEAIVQKVIDGSPGEVERYRSGERKLQGFFVGLVMKETDGKANPKLVNELIGKLISG